MSKTAGPLNIFGAFNVHESTSPKRNRRSKVIQIDIYLIRYYRCSDPDGDGIFDIDEYSCGNFIFDPNQLTCVDPDLPGNEALCTS